MEKVRIAVAVLTIGALPFLGAGPAAAATGSVTYVLRGDVVGEIVDPADGECIPFDDTIMKIVNDTDRTLHLARSCPDGAAAGQVRPGETYTSGSSPPAYAVVPLRPGDPRRVTGPPPPSPEADPSPLPDLSLD